MNRYNYQVGHESLRVDARFEIILSDNREEADLRCWLKAAPAIDEGPGTVAVYVATNGDPVQVATLNKDGECAWYLGEDEPDDTEESTIATALDTFADFIGYSPSECADRCADLFGAAIERR